MQLKKILQWYGNTWIASVTRFSFFAELSQQPLRNAIAFAAVSYLLFFFAQAALFPYQSGPEFQLFLSTIEQALKNANETELLASIQQALPLLFFSNLFISRLVFLALETTLLYFVLKIYRKPRQFTQLLRLTLHVLVLAEVVNQWSQLVLPQATFSMLSLSFWVMIVFVLLQQQKNPNR